MQTTNISEDEGISLPHRRYVWGRRQSRPLKDPQRQAFVDLWTQVSVSLSKDLPLDLVSLFPKPKKDIWLEIGFGGGEHLATQAAYHPQIGFLGCEPFINGVGSILMHIQERSLSNVRLVKDDARLLIARLPEACVGRIFVLFPDPWPKNRHHKRRIIQSDMVTAFARILKENGVLIMATDDAPYAQWMQSVMAEHPAFEMVLEGRASVYERPPHWPVTRYEEKGIRQGRAPAYFIYQLIPSS